MTQHVGRRCSAAPGVFGVGCAVWSCDVPLHVLSGPCTTLVSLLEALTAAGVSEAVQDGVAMAVGEADAVPLARVRALLTGAGLGPAAAVRVVARLVRLVT